MSENPENGAGSSAPPAEAGGVGIGAGEPSTFEPEEDTASVPEEPEA